MRGAAGECSLIRARTLLIAMRVEQVRGGAESARVVYVLGGGARGVGGAGTHARAAAAGSLARCLSGAAGRPVDSRARANTHV